MTGLWCVAVLALAGTTSTTDERAPARAGAEFHFRIGSVAAPFYTAAVPEVRSQLQAYSLIVGGWYALGPRWILGTRVPVATSSIEQPAGSYVANHSIGNPELFVERSVTPPFGWWSGTRLRLSAGAPIAGHGEGPGLVPNRVLAASDALEGWRDPGLFQPGVLPVAAGADATAAVGGGWTLSARLSLPLLIRISQASLPVGSRTRAIGFMPLVELGASWSPRPWIRAGVAGHLVVLAPGPTAPARDFGRSGVVQIGGAPRVSLVFGRLMLGADLLLAVGGPLAGSAGLGLSASWTH